MLTVGFSIWKWSLKVLEKSLNLPLAKCCHGYRASSKWKWRTLRSVWWARWRWSIRLSWWTTSPGTFKSSSEYTIIFYPYAAGTEYIRFRTNFKPINSTRIAKMFCGRCLVYIIITFWRCFVFHKHIYFSSFGAGNCVSNSSSKWKKNSVKEIGSIRVYPLHPHDASKHNFAFLKNDLIS